MLSESSWGFFYSVFFYNRFARGLCGRGWGGGLFDGEDNSYSLPPNLEAVVKFILFPSRVRLEWQGIMNPS